MRKERCKASTTTGRQCKNSATEGAYCKLHKRSVNTCPCCLEDGGNLFVMKPCGHVIHRGVCSDGLTSTKCPMCRVEVENWPEPILEKIDKNESMYREETLMEEARELMQSDDLMSGVRIGVFGDGIMMLPMSPAAMRYFITMLNGIDTESS